MGGLIYFAKLGAYFKWGDLFGHVSINSIIIRSRFNHVSINSILNLWGYEWRCSMSSRLLLCVIITAVFLVLFNKSKRNLWFFSFLVLPGTACHELCHYVSGALLNGQPDRFSVIPRRDGNKIRLGEVYFLNLRWYNVFFIGMAPLVMLLGVYAILVYLQSAPFGYIFLVLLYLVANLAYGSVPSGTDFKLASRSPVGWLLLGAGLMYFGRQLFS